MIVCICGNVTTQQLVESQHGTLDEFKKETGACIQCCSCCDTLETLWEQYHKKQND